MAARILVPATTAGAPTTGTHATGEVYVDSAGVQFVCLVGGSAGTWGWTLPTVEAQAAL